MADSMFSINPMITSEARESITRGTDHAISDLLWRMNQAGYLTDKAETLNGEWQPEVCKLALDASEKIVDATLKTFGIEVTD